MKKIKSASCKASQKLKRTFSRLKGSAVGRYRPSAAERDNRGRDEGVAPNGGLSPMDAAALDYNYYVGEPPSTNLEWAAAAGVMSREQWVVHLRDLETSSTGAVAGSERRSSYYNSSSSVARRGDDEAGEDERRREEERRRRRKKREKEARRRKRREKEREEEEEKKERRNSRHRSKRLSDEDSSTTDDEEEREGEKKRKEKEKRRRREHDEKEEQRGKRERASARPPAREARPAADQFCSYTDAPLQEANADDAPLEDMAEAEEDEEGCYRGTAGATNSEEEGRTGPVGVPAEAGDGLDEARVKSPARDRPSQLAETGEDDEEEGYEDYDYASSGPLMVESDRQAPTLEQLPPATAPKARTGVLGKPLVTSLGLSPPPDDDDDGDDGDAKEDCGAGKGTEQQMGMAMSPKAGVDVQTADMENRSVVFLTDADEGARRESAPSGDVALS